LPAHLSSFDLNYTGKVDLGFDRETAKTLPARLTPLISDTQPYSKRIALAASESSPEIEYRAKSAEGKVSIRSSRACERICDFDRWWKWAQKPPESM
jgi:ATP-dependent DNA ligase